MQELVDSHVGSHHQGNEANPLSSQRAPTSNLQENSSMPKQPRPWPWNTSAPQSMESGAVTRITRITRKGCRETTPDNAAKPSSNIGNTLSNAAKLTHSLTHTYTHTLTHARTHSLTHARTHALTRSLTHSLTHSLTQHKH